jgi:hypothetical protein
MADHPTPDRTTARLRSATRGAPTDPQPSSEGCIGEGRPQANVMTPSFLTPAVSRHAGKRAHVFLLLRQPRLPQPFDDRLRNREAVLD